MGIISTVLLNSRALNSSPLLHNTVYVRPIACADLCNMFILGQMDWTADSTSKTWYCNVLHHYVSMELIYSWSVYSMFCTVECRTFIRVGNLYGFNELFMVVQLHGSIERITIKTPNFKCRLYWCLIEFIDWRYNQTRRVFDPSCERVPL